MEFKDRIELLMRTQHMNRQVFGQLIGISQSTLSNIFNGKTQPTLQMVFCIKEKMSSVNTDWLLFGTGQMFSDHAEDSSSTPPVAIPEPVLDFSDDSHAPLTVAPAVQNQQSVNRTPNIYTKTEVKYLDKPQRQITEIRVFYDDQTWETFVPKK